MLLGLSRWTPLFARYLIALATTLTIAWWATAANVALENAPVFTALDHLEFPLAKGSEVVIGRAELGQPARADSAELQHVKLRRAADGTVLISRAAVEKKLDLEFSGIADDGLSDRYEIVSDASEVLPPTGLRSDLPDGPTDVSRPDGKTQAATSLLMGSQEVRIQQIGGTLKIEVKRTGASAATTLMLDLGRRELSSNGKLLPECFPPEYWPLTSLYRRVQLGLVRMLTDWEGVISHDVRPYLLPDRLAVLGGPKSCNAPLGYVAVALPDADPGAEFEITKNGNDGRLFLSSLSGGSGLSAEYRTDFANGRSVKHLGLTGIEWRVALKRASRSDDKPDGDATEGLKYDLDGVNAFTAGRTHYLITASRDEAEPIVIVPDSKKSLYQASVCADAALTKPTGEQESANGGDGKLLANTPATVAAEDCPPAIQSLTSGLTAENMFPAQQPTASERLFGARHVVELGSIERGLRAATILICVLAALYAQLSSDSTARDQQSFAMRSLTVMRRAFPTLLVASLAILPEIASRLDTYLHPGTWTLVLFWSLVSSWFLTTTFVAKDSVGGVFLGLIWFILTAIIAIGSVSMLTLSSEGPNTDWIRFFARQKLMALDLMPLFVVLSVTMPASRLRRIVGSHVAGRPAFQRAGIAALMAFGALFIAWAFLGTQQGLLSIQPVEAGKFAVIVMAGTVLAQWVIRSRRISRPLWSVSIYYVGFTILFLVLLAAVPVLKSDLSPLIIVILTLTIMASGTLSINALRLFMRRRSDDEALQKVPLLFMPGRGRRSWWRLLLTRSGWFRAQIALALLIGVGAVPVAYFASNLAVEWSVGVSGWRWDDPPEKQIATLQASLGEGRRLLKERLMSWADLRYAPFGKTAKDRAVQLRDLDFQVLRSRSVIAHASCGVSPEFASGPLGTGPALVWVTEQMLDYSGASSICDPLISDGPPPVARCSPASALAPVRPHCVPVVQSDFAATFLIGRHGVGAASILLVFQIAFVICAMFVFVLLQKRNSENPFEIGADQMMANVALGVAALYLAQWILSWSNALGLLPVMGQPMTWLSAGTSHHLFMAIPAAIGLIIATRLVGIREPAMIFRTPPHNRV
ncbi:hypothetical protein [Rhizobium sp. SG_E_25_P2]|uniref:hypothetical protein n=1 Tax=Rhizobium sp. SG_E_25_P2 TaxID=2879942 RepID=UPI00247392A5|nr:hypothetical protein [Rhizobium sp. SG_E_25_P2]